MRASVPLILGACAWLCAGVSWADSKSKGSVQALPPPTVAVARAPIAGQPFDDRELVQWFEQEGRKLKAGAKVRKLSFEKEVCEVALPLAGGTLLGVEEAAARAEASTLVLGEFYRDPKTKKEGFNPAGAGFVVTEAGVCVTSLHVAAEKGSHGLVAMTRDGRVFAVKEALASNAVEDLLVFQLELPPGEILPALPIAGEPAPMGAGVVVVSHPDEHFFLLSTGVVARHVLWREGAKTSNFMSVTADFAKGSSGAPILDLRGRVVGVVNNTESVYYDDDGRKKQMDLQMVVKNATPAWLLRQMMRAK